MLDFALRLSVFWAHSSTDVSVSHQSEMLPALVRHSKTGDLESPQLQRTDSRVEWLAVPLSIQQKAPSQFRLEVMYMNRISMPLALAASLALSLAALSPVSARNQTAASAAPNEVSSGTRFLVRLGKTLATNNLKAGERFTARTIMPIVSADGTTLREGAQIRGHVDRVVPANKAGRARLWLAFDDIQTPSGWIPMVAMVDDAPGVHSIRVDYNREGEIEMSADKRQEALQAAAAAALVGAAPGVLKRDKRDAAIGAAIGAVTAYMAAASLGQDLTIEKNTKLELILERSLFFGRT